MREIYQRRLLFCRPHSYFVCPRTQESDGSRMLGANNRGLRLRFTEMKREQMLIYKIKLTKNIYKYIEIAILFISAHIISVQKREFILYVTY
jgi:hypothetical protein